MKQSLPVESERQKNSRCHLTSSNTFPISQAFVDNRESTTTQRQLMVKMACSPQVIAQRKFSEQAHKSPRMTAQRRQMAKASGGTVQRVGGEEELMQGKFKPIQRVEEEDLLQGKFDTTQLEQAPAEKANNTGLPDNLKQGIENLSGMSMDNVKVHYNSSKPAQLNALAYAQGTDIHVGAGQEKHLPHEAWHVVQQAQGRVKPTMQMKDGVPVNDDQTLEHEADVMGAKAVGSTAQCQGAEDEELLQGKFETVQRQDTEKKELLQGKFDKIQTNGSASHGVTQLFAAYYAWGSANTTPHVHVYNGGMHLKTAGGTRYNIIKNGSKHAQAATALLNVQGKGNKKLRQTIKHTARDTFGIDL